MLKISWEEKSKVLLDPEIFFNGLGDWRMKLSNEDESKLGLEEWNYSDVDSFVEVELESFFLLFRRMSMKNFKYEEVNPVWSGDLNLCGWS